MVIVVAFVSAMMYYQPASFLTNWVADQAVVTTPREVRPRVVERTGTSRRREVSKPVRRRHHVIEEYTIIEERVVVGGVPQNSQLLEHPPRPIICAGSLEVDCKTMPSGAIVCEDICQ